jgi:hypothetical protein
MAEDLVRADALPATERPRDTTADPVRGKWYWIKIGDVGGKPRDPILACVTHVGSNYVALRSPHRSTWRIHFNDFESECTFEPDVEAYIKSKVDEHWGNAQRLIREVQALTARLGVAPRGELTDGATSETQAIAIRRDEPVAEYKKALIKAREKTLPDLFSEIEEENKEAATWMKARLIPLRAEAEGMKGAIDRIQDRIFSVELYAGLVEEVERIHAGKPAPNDEPIHIMQRRHYMDEECLVGYEHGGMEFKNQRAFDRWLCKPKNRDRILPFPRTVVAFRVRRHDKYREADSLMGYISMWREAEADKSTFLYFRNGERVYRLETAIEFEEKLFPDRTERVMGEGRLWGKEWGGEIGELITDDAYQGMLEEARSAKEDRDDLDHDTGKLRELERDYHPYDKKSVYYDDIKDFVEDRAKKYNRLVLIVQGLLDRSPVFHPHPPWQLWTGAGFEAGMRLHFDDDRALVAGDKPDFEAYRAKLNAAIGVGTVTVGQEIVWEMREAAKYNRNERYEFHKKRYRPSGDPGPGTLARVARYSKKTGRCVYEWGRSKRVRGWREHDEGHVVRASIATGEENVLNVDAYTPGDFLIFFDDPRTRQEYLGWAPLLLEAEECHAGNRDIKPGPRRAPARPPRVRQEREAFEVEKKRRQQPRKGDRYRQVLVRLLGQHRTVSGEVFNDGEILLASSYHRTRLTLQDRKKKSRWIRGVHVSDVQIVEKAKRG